MGNNYRTFETQMFVELEKNKNFGVEKKKGIATM